MGNYIVTPEKLKDLENPLFGLIREHVKPEEVQFLMDYWDRFKAKDIETAEHSGRACIMGYNLGQFTRMFSPRTMIYSSFCHDVGKLSDQIPVELLQIKGRKPSDQEMGIIRQHPLLGYKMLLDQDHPFSALAALLHHWFTKGYPEVLPDPILPMELGQKTIWAAESSARIVALADCYDAARYRNNCHGSLIQRKKNPAEIRKSLLEENRDLEDLINNLAKEGIFDIPLA